MRHRPPAPRPGAERVSGFAPSVWLDPLASAPTCHHEERDFSRMNDREAESGSSSTRSSAWKDKCSMCDQPLRMQRDGGIVTWIDSKHYHVSRLLDQLAFPSPVPEAATADFVSHWGPQPP